MKITGVHLFMCVGLLLYCHGTVAKEQNTQSATASEAVNQISALLEESEKALLDSSSLEGFLVCLTGIGAQIDTFEIQFGLKPNKADGWNQVEDRAKTILKKLGSRPERDLYFNLDSAATGRCILLELAGDNKNALTALESIKPGGMCGHWTATVLMSVEQRKSGIYQRTGDYSAALKHQELALKHAESSLYDPEADLGRMRYAFLLAKNGMVDRSNSEYQMILDLYPGTVGAHLARQETQGQPEIVEPTAQRIMAQYYTKNTARNREAAIFALAGHGFPESFELLTKLLNSADEWERNRIIHALGRLGDKRAVPILREIIQSSNDIANCLHAASSLHELGNDIQTLSLIEKIVQEDDNLNLGFAHNILHKLHGNGPVIESTWDIEPQKFGDIWRAWIQAQKPNEEKSRTSVQSRP